MHICSEKSQKRDEKTVWKTCGPNQGPKEVRDGAKDRNHTGVYFKSNQLASLQFILESGENHKQEGVQPCRQLRGQRIQIYPLYLTEKKCLRGVS